MLSSIPSSLQSPAAVQSVMTGLIAGVSLMILIAMPV